MLTEMILTFYFSLFISRLDERFWVEIGVM